MKARLIYLLQFIITIAILTFLFHNYIDIENLKTTLLNTQPSYLILALVFLIINRIITAYQVKLNLFFFRINISTVDIFKAHLISNFYSFILPGDLIAGGITWHILNKKAKAPELIACVVVYLKIVTIITTIPLGLLGLMLEPRLSEINFLFYSALVAAILIPMLAPFFSRRFASFMINMAKKVTTLLPNKLQLKVIDFLERLIEALSLAHNLKLSATLRLWALSFLIHTISAAMVLALFQASNLQLPTSVSLWLISVLQIVHAIPVTVGGLGIRELTLAEIFSRLYNVESEKTLIFSTLIFFLSVLVGGFLGAFYNIKEKKSS